jgi:multisubunit Na+/H+ antiporter MnhB subunit
MRHPAKNCGRKIQVWATRLLVVDEPGGSVIKSSLFLQLKWGLRLTSSTLYPAQRALASVLDTLIGDVLTRCSNCNQRRRIMAELAGANSGAMEVAEIFALGGKVLQGASPEERRSEQYQKAFTAFTNALHETESYIAQLKRNAAAYNQEREDRISALWRNAAQAMAPLGNADLANRCMMKSEGWLDPELWDRFQGVSIESMRKDFMAWNVDRAKKQANQNAAVAIMGVLIVLTVIGLLVFGMRSITGAQQAPWIFGVVFFAFFMALVWFKPQQQFGGPQGRILRVLAAVFVGLIAAFFAGSLHLGGKVPFFSDLTVEATGGLAAFLLVFSTWGKPE